MSHKGIRLLIEDTVHKLGDNIHFTYAKESDFNILRDKEYPFIALDPLTATSGYTVNNTSNFVKVWNAEMAFHAIDNEASTQEEYAVILDNMDDLVDRFIQMLNFYSANEDIIIQDINQTWFIKATADILTGYTLSFKIVVPDNWNYCKDVC